MQRSGYLVALVILGLGLAGVAMGGAQTYPVRLEPPSADPQPAASASPSLVLADGGLQFPDGTIQTTAASGLALVQRTGQSDVFAAGDDGDLQLGVTWPNPRFVDTGDGTVTDNLTGLVWLDDANCFGPLTWANALAKAADLFDGCSDCGGADNDCGLTDGSVAGQWRLPNLREQQSLFHYGVSSPSIPDTSGTGQWSADDPFSGVQTAAYWSSTTVAGIPASAWTASTFLGAIATSDKTGFNRVWLVRGGQ